MKENFERNNNPFCPFGTIGRLGYFITNTLILVISTAFLFFFARTGAELSKELLLTQNYSMLEIMLNNAPKRETAVFVIVVLGIMFFKFIIAKKRILDIAPDSPNIIRNSYLIAFGVALLPFMANFVVQVAGWVNNFLCITSILITLYFICKKGSKPAEKEITLPVEDEKRQ